MTCDLLFKWQVSGSVSAQCMRSCVMAALRLFGVNYEYYEYAVGDKNKNNKYNVYYS